MDGIGRGIRYEVLETSNDVTGVLLTISLPTHVRYRIRWNAVSRDGTSFVLPGAMVLTIFTDLTWRYEDSTLTVETGPLEGEVRFLVESRPPPIRLQDTVILAAVGSERTAVLARAACGRGFVPCLTFVREKSDLDGIDAFLAGTPHRRVLSVGLPLARGLTGGDVEVVNIPDTVESSAEVLQLLRQNRRPRTIVVPVSEEAYGPALFLALELEADLRLEKAGEDWIPHGGRCWSC